MRPTWNVLKTRYKSKSWSKPQGASPPGLTLLPDATLRRTLNLAPRLGWVRALRTAARETDTHLDLKQLFGNETAASYLMVLPRQAKGRVLCLEPATFSEVFALARWADEVVVRVPHEVDRDLLLECLEQQKLENVLTFTGSVANQRFTGFDAVIVNRPGSSRLPIDEAIAALDVGGSLCLVLPGAKSASRVVSVFDAFRQSHDRRRLSRVLAASGFGAIRSFCLAPSVHSPRHLFEAEGGAFEDREQDVAQGNGWLGRRRTVLRRLASQRSVVLSATQGAKPTPWLEDLVGHVADQLGLRQSRERRWRAVVSGGAVGVLIVNLADTAILRIAFDEEGAGRIRNNHAGLSFARDLIDGEGSLVTAPKPMWLGEMDGVAYGVESFVNGRVLGPMHEAVDVRLLDRVVDILLTMQRATSREKHDVDWTDRVVAPILGTLGWVESLGQSTRIRELAEFAKSAAADFAPVVASHGDFKLANMMAEARSGKICLLDWDQFNPEQHATQDICQLIVSRRVAKAGVASPFEALGAWVAGGAVDEAEERIVQRFVRANSLETGWRKTAAISYLARDYGMRLGSRRELDRAWIRRHFIGNLERLHKAIVESA